MTATPSREEAIQARLDAATPGPWSTSGPDTIAQWGIYDSEWLVASAKAYDHDNAMSDKPGARGPGYINPDANAELIANAPSDLAYLLAENDDLRARIDKALDVEIFAGNVFEAVVAVRAALTDEGNTDV